MSKKGIVPEGENLRRAIQWLSSLQTGDFHSSKIEEASIRFDLTPLEEEFLLKNFAVRDNNNPRHKQS